MRCKQGDLAIVVKSKAGNEGKVLTCLKLATPEDLEAHFLHSDVPVWHVDVLIKNKTNGRSYKFVRDQNLKPIRPSEGQDETLSWKDVPHKELA